MKKQVSAIVTMQVSQLTIHPTLRELGIEPLNGLEVGLNKKYGIPNELVITNKEGEVISNWEYVESSEQKTISVFQLDITPYELLLLLSVKNLRKHLKQGKRVLLAVKLREAIKNTGVAKEIYRKLPGTGITTKMAKLCGCSYGTFQKYFLIERYAPELKDRMDEGMPLETAVEIAMENRDKINNRVKSTIEGIQETDPDIEVDKTKKRKVNLLLETFAGQDKFVNIEMLKSLSITKADGTILELEQFAGFLNESKKEPFDGGAEFYQFFEEKTQALFQITIKNL